MRECIGGGEGGQEGGGNGEVRFLHVWSRMAGRWGGWTGRKEAMGRGDFTVGMLGWIYFSQVIPGDPASHV